MAGHKDAQLSTATNKNLTKKKGKGKCKTQRKGKGKGKFRPRKGKGGGKKVGGKGKKNDNPKPNVKGKAKVKSSGADKKKARSYFAQRLAQRIKRFGKAPGFKEDPKTATLSESARVVEEKYASVVDDRQSDDDVSKPSW